MNESKIKQIVLLIAALALYLLSARLLFAAEIGNASWYSREACHEKGKKIYTKDCLTASGKSLYDLERDGVLFAAMWDVKFGTKVRVSNVATGKSVDVVVLDRGPSRRLARPIDLSLAAFRKIADPAQGIARVRVEVLP